MTSRFVSNIVVLLASCFLAVASFAFATSVLASLGLGVGALIALSVLIAFAQRGRGAVQRCLDVAVALLAAWTIVASRTFAGSTEKWLMFSAAATAVLLAVHGLIAHEVVMEVSMRRAAGHDSASSVGAASATAEPAQIRVAR